MEITQEQYNAMVREQNGGPAPIENNSILAVDRLLSAAGITVEEPVQYPTYAIFVHTGPEGYTARAFESAENGFVEPEAQHISIRGYRDTLTSVLNDIALDIVNHRMGN